MPVTINANYPLDVQAGTEMALQAYNGGFGASPPGGVQFTITGPSAETHIISSFSAWSNTEVRFVMPAFANAGAWNGTFTASLTSNTINFTAFVDPGGYFISSISPNPAQAGQTITLSGTFPPTQGTGFGFNLKTGNQNIPNGAITSWSASTITFVLPVTVIGGFPPGLVQIIELWDNGHFPLVPQSLHSNILLNVESNPFITTTIPSPLVVAPNQSFEIVGAFFGYSQGATVCTFHTVTGSPQTIVPTFWGTATSGVHNGQQVITFVVPAGADLSGSDSLVFTNGSFSVTQSLTVEAPLALPGGTSGTRNQPVTLTGSGFGASFGTLTYFSQNGSPIAATATDWSNTVIRTNIPGNADFGPGFFWVFPSGATREAGIFTGFTVGNQASGPTNNYYPAGATIISTNTSGTYPIPPGSQYPRGIIQSGSVILGLFDVKWLNPDGVTYSDVTTPTADITVLAGLCGAAQSVLGTFPPVGGG